MITFGFFFRVFLCGCLGLGLAGFADLSDFEETLIGKIGCWISNVLFYVAFTSVVTSIIGMIWTW